MVVDVSPSALELVRSFVNTRNVEEGTDEIASPEGLAAWFSAHGLVDGDAVPPTPNDLRRAVDLREALRAHLRANNGDALPAGASEVVERQAAQSGLGFAFDDGVVSIVPSTTGVDGTLGLIVAAMTTAMLDGTWDRLKACAAEGCQWAFVDQSRNRSRHWCAMDVCGNREKVRAFRARRR